MPARATTSQTVGPFFTIGMERLNRSDISAGRGERVEIRGKVVDGEGNGVPDAVLEIWQADATGQYAKPEPSTLRDALAGFGRIPTQPDGSFRFTTVKPGRVPAPEGGLQAPHLNVSIFSRGLLQRLVTRLYFPDESSNAEDFALKLVPAARRHSLIARPIGESVLQWNVILQGPGETAFFDI